MVCSLPELMPGEVQPRLAQQPHLLPDRSHGQERVKGPVRDQEPLVPRHRRQLAQQALGLVHDVDPDAAGKSLRIAQPHLQSH